MGRPGNELHKQHFGNADSDLLFWQSASTALNPLLSEKFLQHLRDVDSDSALAEIDAEFLQNVQTLFEAAALDACVDSGVIARPYVPGMAYRAFADAASGTGKDAFTAAIAHADKHDVAVLDALVTIRPPFSPESAIRQVCTLLREYHVTEVSGVRYAPGFVTEAFQRQRITYKPSERDRSTIYLDLLPRVNAGQVRLLDNPDLLRELRGLERHRASTKDRVDHRRGAHDDVANAAAGSLVMAGAVRSRSMQVVDVLGSGRVIRTVGGRKQPDITEDLPDEIRFDPSWRHYAMKEGITAALARYNEQRAGTFKEESKVNEMTTRVVGEAN
ncbi:MAG: hypothetical protein M3541_11705 [Acidobacteriota bacterium]|nr:hypothetical protein [Acidobacteriota bacterium]